MLLDRRGKRRLSRRWLENVDVDEAVAHHDHAQSFANLSDPRESSLQLGVFVSLNVVAGDFGLLAIDEHPPLAQRSEGVTSIGAVFP
jgi:hypothetical protein